MIKRVFDVAVSGGIILILSPVLLTISAIVGLSSGGPILFRHQRVGRLGQTFYCLKFRTMVADAEGWLERDESLRTRHRDLGYKLPVDQDPRITAFGKLLRRSQLDELPQLFNVVLGHMSLVGPRPVVAEELSNFDCEQQTQMLRVRPGIFGPWTVLGRDRPNYPERAAIECRYVGVSSFVGDLSLLLRHVPVLLRGQRDDA